MLRLELVDISKSYPAVKANDRVSLRVAPGEIHAVLGENGAGKSTLMKIIYGAVRPDAGEMRWNGERVTVAAPAEARALGISMVYQHFSLFDTLTAAENVWLGLEKTLALSEVTARIRKVAGEYGLEVDPVRPVHTLSVGEKQRVEIVRALMTAPKLLILDEPTSVLTPQAVQTLFVTLRKLAAEGCSILYISHKLDEIRALCHHCTVLRGGRVTGEVDPTKETNASLSRLMIGAEPPQLMHRAAHPGAVVLSVRDLTLAKEDPFGTTLEGVTFEVRAGEVVGIAGVSGNGQQELMAAISGEDRRAPAGSIRLFERDIARAAPRVRRGAGLHFVPEERLGRVAVQTLSLAQNTLLTRTRAVGAAGWIRVGDVTALAESLIRRFNVKAGGPSRRRRASRAATCKVHRRSRDRRSRSCSSSRSRPGASRRRGRADPRRVAGAARRRLRGAGREWGARRAVRDLRPARRHRPGRVSPARADRRGDGRARRRMDERPVGARSQRAPC
jgi:simple sugar transport system ATP-binding protein